MELDGTDFKKIAIGAAMAGAGAILAYFSGDVIPALEDSSNGTQLFLASLLSVVINAARKLLLDYSK